jgi:dTMP kinase
MFIVFEGLDGSGSTTQARFLKDRLENAGKKVLMTKEPTADTEVGKRIRGILQKKETVTPEELQKLFSQDRAEHLRDVIEPALARGEIVICDRYFFSTLAYGSLAGIDMNWLRGLQAGFRIPDLTLLLKLDPAKCVQRIEKRGGEKELFEQEEKLRAVWKGYELAIQGAPNVHIVDTDRPKEIVAEEIFTLVENRLQ